MEAWEIAKALMVGRDVPATKLQRLIASGDNADRLYVRLFQIARGHYMGCHIDDAAATCPYRPTAAAWSHVMQYASAPTRASYEKIVKATRATNVDTGTVVRLAPLVLSGRHRRDFADVVERAALAMPILRDDMKEVGADLRMPGPARIYAKRAATVRSRRRNGS